MYFNGYIIIYNVLRGTIVLINKKQTKMFLKLHQERVVLKKISSDLS